MTELGVLLQTLLQFTNPRIEKSNKSWEEESKHVHSYFEEVEKLSFADSNLIRIVLPHGRQCMSNAHAYLQKKYQKDDKVSNYKGESFLLSVVGGGWWMVPMSNFTFSRIEIFHFEIVKTW